MSFPPISIIVPVYKAEAYLHRCVDNLLAQTFTKFEVLLIDDGSPDRSGEICDEYAKKDARVRVFHKENGGVSSARQCGMDNAQGEYTIHTDPDDWVAPTMLEELYAKAKEEDADIVICDFFTEKRGKTEYTKNKINSLNHKELLIQLLQQEIHASLCNKLIKKSCYDKYTIKFPNNITLWEDLFVVCSILIYPIKVAYLPKAFYHYDFSINTESIVRKPTMKGIMSQIYFIDHFAAKLGEQKEYELGIYKMKASTKELAYTSGLMSDDKIKTLYEEINERYIADKSKKYIIHKCLSLLLKGHPYTGKILYKPYLWLVKFKGIVYRIIPVG